MKNGRNKRRRKLSAGSVFMLALMAMVLCGSVLVLGRLSSGASVDLNRLQMTVLDLQSGNRNEADDTEEQPENNGIQMITAGNTAMPRSVTETPVPVNDEDSITLTLGGSISLSGEVRKNSRSTDSKVADYADVMMLLAPEINNSMNGVFLENILSDRHKASDTVAPAEAAMILKEAGFDYAACGFSQAYSSGKDGVSATLETLSGQGIRALGIRGDDAGIPEVRTVNRVRTAIMQYTATVPEKTRKSMLKEGTSGMVPEADLSLISADIASAREQGAEAVIVLINWGKTGKDPDSRQIELAREIAQAGADLIVGNGSHVPQTAEFLPGREGKEVLCVWSLGSLLSGDRSNIRRLSGYLLHITIRRDGKGGVEIRNPEYTPVYTWKYKQDGRFYYRCVSAGARVPDGMDSEQQKNMARAAETVRNVLKDSPLTERGRADAE